MRSGHRHANGAQSSHRQQRRKSGRYYPWKQDVWKVGYSVDVDQRVESINQHIPVELGVEAWTAVYRHKMKSADAAYKMEQRVLELLAAKRSGFERVRCTQAELQTAWQQAYLDAVLAGQL
jgi:hypothetical protein